MDLIKIRDNKTVFLFNPSSLDLRVGLFVVVETMKIRSEGLASDDLCAADAGILSASICQDINDDAQQTQTGNTKSV